MEIKYLKDKRKIKNWQKVLSIDFMTGYYPRDKNRPVVHTEKYGFVLLEDCKVRNGNFDN